MGSRIGLTAAAALRVVLQLLVCGAVAGPAQAGAPPGRADLAACDSLLNGYLAAVANGDTSAALACWRRADVDGAARLAIVHPGAPVKVDGDSPLWWQEAGTGGTVPPLRRQAAEAIPDGTVRQAVVFGAGADTLRFSYHFALDDGRWRLASPVALAVAAMDRHAEGRYVSLAGPSAGSGMPAAPLPLAALDSSVAAMLDKLDADADVRARLEAGKLGYLLTAPPEVARLAGAPTVGVANLQQDIVITSHPGHTHELAHLVVNAWLREVPPFMLPLLQEGIAVHLGGRWGRHPRVLERLGRTTILEGWLTLEDLLSRDGFLTQPADLGYAPAGAFAGFILDDYGPEGLRRACLAVSGTATDVAGWDADAVKARLAKALATDWSALEAGFARRVAAPVSSGLTPGRGPIPAPPGDGLRATVRDEAAPAPIVVTIAGEPGVPRALLFGDGGGGPVRPNALFAEHFPGRAWRGETHALLLTADEARFYDYRLQMLVALHAEGFWPEPGWPGLTGGAVSIDVDRLVWPGGSWEVVAP